MSDQEIYKRFIDWLGKTWWGLPESEYLMPMIEAIYTPEDAELLTGMPFSGKSLEELAALKNMKPEELTPRLTELARKGLVYESIRGDSVRYRLADSFFVTLRSKFWHGQTDAHTKKIASSINKYMMDGWMDQYADAQHKGLRTIPINKTVEDTRQLLPFEDIIKVLDEFEYFTVSACPCRHRHNLDPDTPNCNHPMEVCLHFDELGRYIVKNGLGREITKEETFDILRKSADAGLVHAISNWEEKPDTICNCCSDACLWFEAYHKLGHGKSVDPSNYTIKVNQGTCKGCALCVKRCHMDALQLKVSDKAKNKIGKAATLNPDQCIGCGVCVHKCPTNSLVLEQNENITSPPRNAREYGSRFMADRQAARKKRSGKTS